MPPTAEPTIQALAATFTPSLQGDRAELRRVYSNFLYVYGDLPADTRTKLALLVRVVEGLSRLRHGRAFSVFPPERRGALARSERHLHRAGPVGANRIRRPDSGNESIEDTTASEDESEVPSSETRGMGRAVHPFRMSAKADLYFDSIKHVHAVSRRS